MSAVLAPSEAVFTPGIDYDLPADVYHRIEALSAGGAKKLLQSPAHFRLSREKPSAPTAEMQIGTAIHTGLLEPHLFASTVLRTPTDAPKRPSSTQINAAKPSQATLDAIEWWTQYNASTAGKLVFDAETHDRIQNAIQAVLDHPGASRLLAHGRPEVTMQWVDGKYGIPCKSRTDWQRNDGGKVDLKSTADASPDAAMRAIGSFGYHTQAAHYWAGDEAVLGASPAFWAFVFVETTEPFGVGAYVLEHAAIRAGMAKMDRAARLYAECMKTGKFPAYSDLIEPINAPRWALIN